MITIIDYNAGNIRSVLRACKEVGVRQNPSLVSPFASLRAGSFVKGDVNTPEEEYHKNGFQPALE